jgi:P4 family phage/plasmid primase-like protien
MARKPNPDRSFAYVKGRAAGRWVEILSALAHVSSDYLTGRHGPCPKCGGTDRWRWTNLDDGGGGICNQCGKFGDGFALLQSLCGWDAKETLRRVAEHLGCQGGGNSGAGTGRNGKASIDPAKDLRFDAAINSMLAAHFCRAKPPITLDALIRCHARQALYRGQYKVIAIPVWGEKLTAAEPVGWALYDIRGGTLPLKKQNSKTGEYETVERLKVKLTYGSQQGILGPVDDLAESTHLWKLEGITDLLTFYSLERDTNSIAAGHAAITNANGAGEKPLPWMLELFAGRHAYTLHDADIPGQRGASGYTDDADDFHPGWGNWIASRATTSRVPELPYQIEKNHGKDLRDFAQDRVDVFAELLRLAEVAPEVPAAELPGPGSTNSEDFETDLTPNEAIDDPHRLAVANLERYAALTDGGTIRYWREEWYVYKANRYRKISPKEFAAKISGSVKEEFNRANILAQMAWEKSRQKQDEETDKSGKPKPRPEARKVTRDIVANVIQATSSMQILSSEIELNSLIDSSGRRSGSQQPQWIAMKNGILDLGALLADEEDELRPHTSDWFSTVCLPYEYSLDAECPQWEAFLKRNLEDDRERIAVLQEWFGYCLIPSTDYQKFLFMEGEGSNGKSVALAVMEAMIGKSNCSHVSLEDFNSEFMLGNLLGRLLNFSNECSEIDNAAEGKLKAMTSGDPMTFNRKNLSPIECTPYARLVLSGNSRPRFSDKTFGLWRRMICMPWRVTIEDDEKIIGMDKTRWWEQSGELPGVFNWAVVGLARLLQQRKFSESKVIMDATNSYRLEMNPTKLFLQTNYTAGPKDSCWVGCNTIFDQYKGWATENGYRPVSDGTFGKELKKHFKHSERKRLRFSDGTRQYAYTGIRPGSASEEGEEIDVSTFEEQKELFNAN